MQEAREWKRKIESRMLVAKRQGRKKLEKPVKTEERKV